MKNKKVLSLNKDQFLKGFQLTYDNSIRLFNAAVILEEKKQYPVANSLLILSAEEGIKAFAIITQSFYPEKEIENFGDFFRKHDFKIDNIRRLMVFTQLYQNFFKFFYDPIIENIKKTPEEIKVTRAKRLQKLVDWLKNDAMADNNELSKQNVWWKYVNNMKKNCFYVNYNEGQWSTPASLKKVQYDKTKKYVGDFIKQLESLKNIDFNDINFIEIVEELKQKTFI